MVFEHVTARAHQGQPAGRLPEAVAVEAEPQVGQRVTDRHPVRRQVIGQAGQQLLEGLLPAGQQPVDVLALRNAPTRLGSVRQSVALDHDDGGEPVGQHPGREQPGHAAAEYDSAVSKVSSHGRYLLPEDCGRTLIDHQSDRCSLLLSRAHSGSGGDGPPSGP